MSFNSKSLPPPTAEQKLRWELMRALSCVTCYMRDGTSAGPLEIHHLTVGDRHGAPRLGHDYTVCLCAWCHRGVHYGQGVVQMEYDCGPSFALTPRAFRREYGGGEYLLKTQNELIGWTKPPQRERVRRNGSPTARPSKSFRPATEAKTLSDDATRPSRARVQKKKRESRTATPDKCRIGWTRESAESSN